MTARRHIALAVIGAAVIARCAVCGIAADPAPVSPEKRAVAFLAAEVPRWTNQNDCCSCHNNGDAARALMWAAKTGLLMDRAPLADTLRFLADPDRWDANGPDGPFKDKKLARIQFGAALSAAVVSDLLDDQEALAKGAALVAQLQSPDGYWETDAPGTIGSPVTYGRALATLTAQQVLLTTDDRAYDEAIASAARWFEQTEAKSVLDAAVTLQALGPDEGDPANARRRQCLEVIGNGRSPDGGWGPFVNSASEPFDTALVLIGLVVVRDGVHLENKERTKVIDWIAGGRAYLRLSQEPDGGWPPTTRPPGIDSYAQRLSTTAWAAQALLATRPGR